MTASLTILATPGTNQVYHPLLVGVTILGIKREGVGYNRTVGAPTNQQYEYIAGRIIFDGASLFGPGEKVWALYQH
jgi:hypothetical protein